MSRVTVVGAGGIGGITAAALRLAGVDVELVDANAAHVAAIRERGLLVTGIRGEHRVRFDAVHLPEEWTGPADLVVLAVKSQHTRDALDTIEPHLHPGSRVVSLQNGWNAQVIAERIGAERTVITMLHVVGNAEEPGHVSRHTEGTVYIARELGGDVVAAQLATAFPIKVVDNIWGYVWSKQVYGATMPVNALVDQPARDTYAHAWVQSVLVAIMAEAADAAAAEHVKLEAYERFDPHSFDGTPSLHQLRRNVPRGSAKGNSGIWHDIKVRNRKTEIDYLTGELVRIGRRHGLAMELNGLVVDTITAIESGHRAMGWDNVRALAAPAHRYLSAHPSLAACLPPLSEELS